MASTDPSSDNGASEPVAAEPTVDDVEAAVAADAPPDSEQVDEKEKETADIKAKWPGWPGYSVFRIVVPVLKVGGIIGRKGDLIKKLVEDTGAKIRVLEGPKTSPDRIVSSFYFCSDSIVTLSMKLGVCGTSFPVICHVRVNLGFYTLLMKLRVCGTSFPFICPFCHCSCESVLLLLPLLLYIVASKISTNPVCCKMDFWNSTVIFLVLNRFLEMHTVGTWVMGVDIKP